jgi:hypothetical protein
MTDYFVWLLVALAAVSLGLRITSVLIPGVNSLVRLIVALVIGGALAVATLRTSDSYHVYDLGLGLLVSLSPVGAYDLAKWWFHRRPSRRE